MPAFRFPTQTVIARIAEDAAPAKRAALLAETARRGVAELIASGRASPQYRTFVDGVEGRSEDQVRADGTIAYRFNYMGQVVVFALEYLRARSPVDSGLFRDSFRVGVNGRDIDADKFNPRMVPDDAEIIIYNKQPYSRKVDVQLVGRKKLNYSKPANLFYDARDAVRARFGNLVTAERLYTTDFPGRKVIQGSVRQKMRGRGLTKGRKVEYPALAIGVR